MEPSDTHVSFPAGSSLTWGVFYLSFSLLKKKLEPEQDVAKTITITITTTSLLLLSSNFFFASACTVSRSTQGYSDPLSLLKFWSFSSSFNNNNNKEQIRNKPCTLAIAHALILYKFSIQCSVCFSLWYFIKLIKEYPLKIVSGRVMIFWIRNLLYYKTVSFLPNSEFQLSALTSYMNWKHYIEIQMILKRTLSSRLKVKGNTHKESIK